MVQGNGRVACCSAQVLSNISWGGHVKIWSAETKKQFDCRVQDVGLYSSSFLGFRGLVLTEKLVQDQKVNKHFQGSVGELSFTIQILLLIQSDQRITLSSILTNILLSLSVHFFFLHLSLIYGQRGWIPVGISPEQVFTCMYHSINTVIERRRVLAFLNVVKVWVFLSDMKISSIFYGVLLLALIMKQAYVFRKRSIVCL